VLEPTSASAGSAGSCVNSPPTPQGFSRRSGWTCARRPWKYSKTCMNEPNPHEVPEFDTIQRILDGYFLRGWKAGMTAAGESADALANSPAAVKYEVGPAIRKARDERNQL